MKKKKKIDEKMMMQIGGVVAVALISYGLGAAITSKPVPVLKDGAELVAELNGKKITANEYYDELKELSGAGILVNYIDEFIAHEEIETTDEIKDYAKTQVDDFKKQVATQKANFLETINGYGFKDEEAFYNYFIVEKKKKDIVNNYLEKNITDKEIKDYYDKEIFGKISARHILVETSVKTDMTDEEKLKADAKDLAKAKALITKLDGGANFAELAKAESDDEGSKANGGLYEKFAKGYMVDEFWDAAYALKNGEYTKQPVKTSFGYHVILKVDYEAKPTLDAVKAEVIEKLVTKKLTDDTELKADIWADIREDYKLNIFDPALKLSYDKLFK